MSNSPVNPNDKNQAGKKQSNEQINKQDISQESDDLQSGNLQQGEEAVQNVTPEDADRQIHRKNQQSDLNSSRRKNPPEDQGDNTGSQGNFSGGQRKDSKT